MSRLDQPRRMPLTRQASRLFGSNITNNPLQKQTNLQLKASHAHTHNHTQQNTVSSNWLQTIPEMRPYQQQLLLTASNKEADSYLHQDFMLLRIQISASMRQKLISWMIEIHAELNLKRKTLFLAVLILDKYCSKQSVSRLEYQLLGLVALFIAGKYEDVRTPKLRNYVRVVKGTYQPEEILSMESGVLIALNFEIRVMTRVDYLDEYLHFVNWADSPLSQLCRYILDLTLVKYGFCLLRPSLVSWAVIVVVSSRRQIMPVVCSEQIVEVFSVEKMQLQRAVQMVDKLCLTRRDYHFKQINRHYSLDITGLLQD